MTGWLYFLLSIIYLVFLFLKLVLPAKLLPIKKLPWPDLVKPVWAQSSVDSSLAESELNALDQNANLIFADDFANDLSRWDLVRGSWSDWQVVAGWLQGSADVPFYISELTPKQEFWNSGGDSLQYQFDFQVAAGQDYNWSFAFEDQNNWYELHFYQDNLHLTKVQNGMQVFNRYAQYGLQPNQIYHARLNFLEGRIQVWINQELVLDEYDYTYQPGFKKISVKTTAGASYPTKVRFDNIRVYSLAPQSSKQLPVARFQQNDSVWASEEYDSGSDWSKQPTIERWGCALSSMAMVFNYYDLDKLPDGQPLNPSTLNQWLKSQSDGYIGGSVNWLAGARLSRLISERYSTADNVLPVLEYQRLMSPEHSQLTESISYNRTVIVNTPGHFFVAEGYVFGEEGESELNITDPFYDYDQLSQHQDDTVISAGIYQPSQTDLSYFLLVYDLGLQADITDEQGQSVSGQILTQDTLSDPVSETGELSQSKVFHYLPQPDTGNYQVRVAAEQAGAYQLDLFFYDQNADWKHLSREEFLLAEGTGDFPEEQCSSTLLLSFDKTDSFQTNLVSDQEADFAMFLQKLEQAKTDQAIGKSYVYFYLKEVGQLASQLEPNQIIAQDRYRQLLIKLIAEHQERINDSAVNDLLDSLNERY